MRNSAAHRLRWIPAILFLVSMLSQAAEKPEEGAKEEPAIPEPTTFVTQHSGKFNNQPIKYTVTAGETYLRDEAGKPKAAIFAFAYTKLLPGKGEVRPVTFVWNGGPGSASLWLHMGSMGAKRVSVPSDASNPRPPPYPLLDAPETILDVTDLVFVDPVGTGFSRPLGKHEGKEFWGLTEDALSMAEFIQTWITANGRWNSPRFILGESFGTTRAAAVAKVLEGDAFMMRLNGLVFISQALDYAGSSPYVRDNIVSHITYLPTMAAAAWYHNKVLPRPDNLADFLVEARKFAVDELLPALFLGNKVPEGERVKVRDRLAWFTGLTPEYIERANLRVQGFRFAKELLRSEGLAIGLLDARYKQDEIDDLEADPRNDAASDAVSSAFKSALMTYMRSDLNVTWERQYLASGGEDLSKQWNWSLRGVGESWEPSWVNTAHDLSEVLRRNPDMKVMVASGYYDLVTPFFDAEFTLNRHDIRPDQVWFRYYGGGHMMYVNEPSRTQLLGDIRRFIVEQRSP